MLKTFKKTLSRLFLGEPVKDWGVVLEHQPGFFREQVKLGLYRKDGRNVLCLTVKYSSSISGNLYALAIPVSDLRFFVSTLEAGCERLRRTNENGGASMIDPADKIPFVQRMMLHLIHGIRASRLLIDLRDPATNRTEYRFYGYITRRSRTMALIHWSKGVLAGSESVVVSGEALEAVVRVLSEHLESAPGRAAAGAAGTVGV